MTVFIAIAVLLTVLALAWLVRPLLWPAARSGVSSERLNASIYRDQLETLERDVARGVISAADCEATKDELQLRLLDDTADSAALPPPASTGFWSGRRTAAAIALLLPLGAGGMYWWLGTPAAIDPVAAQKANNDQVATMVDTLAARLKANPDNPKGWAMLARSYKVMGRFAEAEQAFVKAGNLVNTEPDLLVDYADLLAVRANNDIEGKPLELVNKALALNPQHPMGLMMSGVAAYRRSDFTLAVKQWEKLLTVLDPGSPDAQQVEADIADARAKAGLPTGAAKAASGAKPGAGADAGKLPPVDPAAAPAMTPEKINQMIDGLAARLKANPDDLAGWIRLGRAYKVQGRLAEAEQAYGKAGKLIDTDADLLTQYADLLATRSGNIEGRPLALVNKALVLNPKHPVALMLAGTAAYRRSDYAQAVAHWEKVLAVLPPGSPDAKQVEAEIADARTKGGLGLAQKAKP
ncbi:MAG: c-type cytochrome biogenesis protein CcmI [Rhodoferax sp.]|uniref:c-type cytochrome biogenesis protein CcmI n=1 Tax=Rhodoferax sp. TaxID=50421 RepID=UPI00260B809B|nr:c-type cytochrome biogenesis protein CcmI [Rhodoferax sp.]MDD5333730.1 c-type cytochrome biogenesis protein CcmI [Rhodoferax sp.]